MRPPTWWTGSPRPPPGSCPGRRGTRPPAPPGASPTLRVAPLEVGRVLRNRLFAQRTVTLTSATLALGGSFAPLAIQWGLSIPRGDDPPQTPPAPGGTHPPRPPLGETGSPDPS